jgi:hypothetical protein
MYLHGEAHLKSCDEGYITAASITLVSIRVSSQGALYTFGDKGYPMETARRSSYVNSMLVDFLHN